MDAHEEHARMTAEAGRTMNGAARFLFQCKRKRLLEQMARERRSDRETYRTDRGTNLVAFAANPEPDPEDKLTDGERGRLLRMTPIGRSVLEAQAPKPDRPGKPDEFRSPLSGLASPEIVRLLNAGEIGRAVLAAKRAEFAARR